MNSRRNRRWQFGTLVDVALAALAMGGAAFAVDLVLSFHWTPRTAAFDCGEALYYPTSALLAIAGIGAALVVAGLRLGLHRQYYNWLFVGTGVGVLVLGTSGARARRHHPGGIRGPAVVGLAVARVAVRRPELHHGHLALPKTRRALDSRAL